MKTLPILCLLIASLATASAQTNTNSFTLNWIANPPTDLVTNYMIRCVRPLDDTVVLSNHGVATNATITLDPGEWECVCMAQNSYFGIGDPSNIVLLGQPIVPPIVLPPGAIATVTVNSIWSAGAFDITARWGISTNAASYTASLINLVSGAVLTRNTVIRNESWLRVPASGYRLTVAGVATNGLQGPVTTVELGVLKPGKVRDFK